MYFCGTIRLYFNCINELIKNNGEKVKLSVKELEERISEIKINS